MNRHNGNQDHKQATTVALEMKYCPFCDTDRYIKSFNYRSARRKGGLLHEQSMCGVCYDKQHHPTTKEREARASRD